MAKVAEPLLQLLLYVVGKRLEEVATQNERDTGEQSGIDTILLKEAIDIGTIARQTAGKPADAAFLPLQFLLDKQTDGFHPYSLRTQPDASPPCEAYAYT